MSPYNEITNNAHMLFYVLQGLFHLPSHKEREKVFYVSVYL